MLVATLTTVTDPTDLLDEIRSAALGLANPWTVHNFSGGQLNLSLGGHFVNLFADSTDIYGAPSTGYSVGQPYWDHAGSPLTIGTSNNKSSRANNIPGAYSNVWIFATGAGEPDYMHIVIENESGRFSAISFGFLDECDPSIGGGYLSMTYWSTSDSDIDRSRDLDHSALFDNNSDTSHNSWLRADIDGATENFINNSSGTEMKMGSPRSEDAFISAATIEALTNDFNGRPTFEPIVVSVERPSSFYSLEGVIPGARLCTMRNRTPAFIQTQGSDEWMMFPIVKKTESENLADNTYNSYIFGFSFKR